MITLAISNQKGGVGKTTTAVNVAHYFADMGQRVLLVDLDSQGHVAAALGQPSGNGLQRIVQNKEPIAQVAIAARQNLDIITNDHTAEAIRIYYQQLSFQREYLLANVFEQVSDQYDLVVLDTAPSADALHATALIASDYLLIPAIMDFLAMRSVLEIIGTVQSLGTIPNVIPPAIIGILPTMYDRTTKETSENVLALQKAIGEISILPPIPRDTRLREATHDGKTIWEFSPTSAGAVGWSNGSPNQNSLKSTGGYLHVCEILESVFNS